MADGSFYIPEEERLDRPALQALQRRKFTAMWQRILPGNEFYKRKFASLKFDPSRDPISALPLTTRAELEADQLANPPYGSNLSFPREQYIRLHQTSGSAGRPLRWLDTAENWSWWKKLWGIIFAAAGVGENDRLAFPFSFGPFVGFWGAFEAASALGRFILAAGGMSTIARLKFILENEATVICCTPTYALRLAEVAEQEKIDIAGSKIRAFIVAGEPGGHVPTTRHRIEAAFNARVFDHTGMTEIGPLGFECLENPEDVHLIESECIAEVIDPATLQPVEDGQGELVITNLGRPASPVIRYRTGDHVRILRDRCKCGRYFARMQGGILGRIDDMFVVRGNNIFPTAMESVIRRFADVAEFGVEVRQNGALAQVKVTIEPIVACTDPKALVASVGKAIHDELLFKADVELVPHGSLPRFEMKAKRFKKV
jgi:phenylacetate-CoA ligase